MAKDYIYNIDEEEMDGLRKEHEWKREIVKRKESSENWLETKNGMKNRTV